MYSGLTLNQYGVASSCRTICTVCGASSPCPDLKLIHYKTEKDEEGNIVSITYKGRMEAGEFTAFPFIALNPKGDVSVKYKAYVTYADGVVVPFDGSEEAKGYQPTIHLK